MQVMTEVLENELKKAVEVKDEQSLHRWVTYLVSTIPTKEQNESEHSDFKEALLKMDAKTDAILIELREGFKRMDERFAAVDKRFEAVDKRFDDVNKRFDDVNKRFEAVDRRFDDMHKRFSMLFSFITIGFVMIGTMVTLLQLFG